MANADNYAAFAFAAKNNRTAKKTRVGQGVLRYRAFAHAIPVPIVLALGAGMADSAGYAR